MQNILDDLVERLKQAYGADLLSVILYGSAAVGDAHAGFSDVNVLCVVRDVTPKELAASEPIFRWWRDKGNPAPLLMKQDEVARSTDCFPIEFHDMLQSRRVLHGADVVAGLQIDDRYYRAYVEQELRAKLFRLRQKAGGVLNDNELLLRLMAGSLSTFCVLARHALRLGGHAQTMSKRDTVAGIREHLGVAGRAFDTLLDLREGRVKSKTVQPRVLFADYLKEIEALVSSVDNIPG
ncbi:MAG: nucleotidyltransferase domain-containing protein [Bryobacterales bacterium]|nr:nucleotidyltransferase domain-containing protein [Bryobacterales bacterium]